MRLFGRESDANEEERERKEEGQFREKLNSRLGFIKTDEQAETLYNANLLIVGAHLTQVCHPTGGAPKEILSTYTQLMEGLIDWFNITPLRERLEDMLEEAVWSKWAVKEQPVVPTYTPLLKRKQMGNTEKPGG